MYLQLHGMHTKKGTCTVLHMMCVMSDLRRMNVTKWPSTGGASIVIHTLFYLVRMSS